MEQRTSLTEIIEHINPSELTYQEWCSVGMALKQEGYPVSVWDAFLLSSLMALSMSLSIHPSSVCHHSFLSFSDN